MQARAVEILTEAPTGIDPRERALGGLRWRTKASLAVVFGRSLQDAHQPGEEHLFGDRRPGAAAIDDDVVDGIRKGSGPVVRHLSTHRPAIDTGDAIDAELPRQQPTLRLHTVPGRHQVWIVRVIRRTGR